MKNTKFLYQILVKLVTPCQFTFDVAKNSLVRVKARMRNPIRYFAMKFFGKSLKNVE
jgi:hypothetical protein